MRCGWIWPSSWSSLGNCLGNSMPLSADAATRKDARVVPKSQKSASRSHFSVDHKLPEEQAR